jgi:hypothetical protein
MGEDYEEMGEIQGPDDLSVRCCEMQRNIAGKR